MKELEKLLDRIIQRINIYLREYEGSQSIWLIDGSVSRKQSTAFCMVNLSSGLCLLPSVVGSATVPTVF